MEVDEFSLMIQAMEMIDAKERLLDLSNADYPYLKKDSREKIHRALHKQARPNIFNEKKPITTKELAMILIGKGS